MAGEQTAANVIVAIKRESTPGVAAGATGAQRLRITDSPGLSKDTALAQSNEKRSDGNRQKGRHSGVTVGGSLNTEMTVGGAIDILLEAIMRSTWTASATHTQTEFTSLAISSNVITAGGGSFITQGYRVGQIIQLTGMTQTANNDVNCLVHAVTTSTLSVEPANGTALTDEGADTTFSIKRLGHVVNATTPTRYHHTVDQYDQDIDLSEQFLGVKVVGVQINIVPNQPVTMQFTFQGLDSNPLATGDSPYFTSPNLTTGLAVVSDDITIRYNGSVVTSFTGLTINLNIAAGPEGVVGARISPDIFDNDLEVSAQATAIRSDFSNLTLHDAETEFEIGILLEDTTSTAPFDCYGLHFPIVTVDNVDAPAGGGDGAKIETINLGFGTKPSGVSGYDATIATISSSAQA